MLAASYEDIKEFVCELEGVSNKATSQSEFCFSLISFVRQFPDQKAIMIFNFSEMLQNVFEIGFKTMK